MSDTARVEREDWRGLACTRLTLPNGDSALVSDLGAQVLSWVAGGHERLFLSPQAVLDGSAPIRGGIPICFPQFNARGALPKHGLARLATWESAGWSLEGAGDRVVARWQWQPAAPLHVGFPHAVEVTVAVHLSPGTLAVALQARNPGSTPWAMTAALHTYLAVHDAAACQLIGLQDQSLWDAAQGFAPAVQHGAVTLGAEVDRVYARSDRELALQDGDHLLAIAQDATWNETVVWNPGPALCSQLADMAPDSWQHMVCVEAAAINQPVALLPGAVWQGRQVLTVRR